MIIYCSYSNKKLYKYFFYILSTYFSYTCMYVWKEYVKYELQIIEILLICISHFKIDMAVHVSLISQRKWLKQYKKSIYYAITKLFLFILIKIKLIYFRTRFNIVSLLDKTSQANLLNPLLRCQVGIFLYDMWHVRTNST